MEGIIYKYTNKVNGKVYIGQTLDEEKRYRDHKFCKPVYVDGVRFESIRDAADFLGCDRHNIHPAIRKGNKIYGHTVSWEVN